ncbi:MAG: hypothetical protein LBR81_09220 [Prevotellaceae bacterium]|jgi:hypothetical protein|nr:hypothetical protein [Prevotellaceae bacterium]
MKKMIIATLFFLYCLFPTQARQLEYVVANTSDNTFAREIESFQKPVQEEDEMQLLGGLGIGDDETELGGAKTPVGDAVYLLVLFVAGYAIKLYKQKRNE